jgi:DNA replicative helicase MCM subunit Mcm2 (Cdc46/Mcm family)
MPQSIIETSGIDGLTKYLTDVYLNGKDKDEAFNLAKPQLVENDVQILTRSAYAKEVIVAMRTTAGEILLPDLLINNVPKNMEIIETRMEKVYTGKLIANDVEMKYISLDEINTLGRVKVFGAKLGVLGKAGFVNNIFIIIKAEQKRKVALDFEKVKAMYDFTVGDYIKNASILATIFAPDIVGLDDVKLALIAEAVGAGPLSNERFTLNTILIGPPSTAKTRLSIALCDAVERCAFVSASESTEKSLLAAYDKDTGEISPGPLVLLSGDHVNFGIVIINEAQKLKNISELRDALEEQHYEIHKGGKHLSADTRVGVVMNMNPVPGDFAVNFIDNFPRTWDAAILSRMDMIIPIPGVMTKERFLNIAKAIIDKFQGKVPKQDNDALWSYIKYARSLDPRIPPSTEKYIIDMMGKVFDEYKEKGLQVWVRTAVSFLRIVRAFAKALLVKEVTPSFVDFVIDIQKHWLNRLVNPDAKTIYYAILSGSEVKFVNAMLELMRQYCTPDTGGCSLIELAKMIEDMMEKNNEIRQSVEDLMAKRGYKTLTAYLDEVIIATLTRRPGSPIYKCKEGKSYEETKWCVT